MAPIYAVLRFKQKARTNLIANADAEPPKVFRQDLVEVFRIPTVTDHRKSAIGPDLAKAARKIEFFTEVLNDFSRVKEDSARIR